MFLKSYFVFVCLFLFKLKSFENVAKLVFFFDKVNIENIKVII
jgi:hypothetical protein